MPTKEIKAAIVVLEGQLKHYEVLFDQSIANNEIFAKTKILLLKLKEVSQELNELKKYKDQNGH